MSYLRQLLEGQPVLKKRITAFVAKVREAWGDLPYPGDDNIVPETNPLFEEPAVVQEIFTGKRWQEVTLQDVFTSRDHSVWFTPQAFRYYMGVFMIAAIIHYYEVDVAGSSTFHYLTPPRLRDPHWTDSIDWTEIIPKLQRSFLERASKFDAAQRAVIIEFLELHVLVDRGLDPDDDFNADDLAAGKEFWSHPEFEKMIADKLKADS